MVLQHHSVMYGENGDHEGRILPSPTQTIILLWTNKDKPPQKFHNIFCKLVSLMIHHICDSDAHDVGGIPHLLDPPPIHVH